MLSQLHVILYRSRCPCHLKQWNIVCSTSFPTEYAWYKHEFLILNKYPHPLRNCVSKRFTSSHFRVIQIEICSMSVFIYAAFSHLSSALCQEVLSHFHFITRCVRHLGEFFVHNFFLFL